MRIDASIKVRTGRFAPLLPEEGWTRFADGVVGGDWVLKAPLLTKEGWMPFSADGVVLSYPKCPTAFPRLGGTRKPL